MNDPTMSDRTTHGRVANHHVGLRVQDLIMFAPRRAVVACKLLRLCALVDQSTGIKSLIEGNIDKNDCQGTQTTFVQLISRKKLEKDYTND
jgi:hypothetical protein